MISFKETSSLIKHNKYLILAIIFFLAYRTFFTWLLFTGRSVPPEPDDSYFYLAASKIFPTINTFEDFRLFYFSAWIRLLALFIGNNLELAYKLNFYIGPLIMIYPLYFFISKLSHKKLEVAFLVFIITLFSGSGQYHGFYWVVPSFYHFTAFLLLLGYIVSDKKESLAKIALASFLFIFSHPTSLFVSLIFYVYGILTYFLNSKAFKVTINNLTKLTASIVVAFLSYFLIANSFPANNSPESFNKVFELLQNFSTKWQEPISLPMIRKEYFSIIAVNPVILILFLFIVAITLIVDKKLLSLFAASLTLVLVAVYIPYGARTLAYLWPITFLMVGTVFIVIYKYLKTTRFRLLILLPLSLFVLLATTFNLIYIKSVNASKDYGWYRLCPKTFDGYTIFFKSLEGKHAFSTFSNNSRNYYFLSEENLKENIKDGSLIVLTGRLKYTQENLTKTEQLLAKNVTRRETVVFKKTPDNGWTQEPVKQEDINQLLNNLGFKYNLSQDCGYYKVYKINKI